jgi:hypothetical protein
MLIVLAWVASLAALPVCFIAMVGWGMSPSGPHARPVELLMLGAGPIIALAALSRVPRAGRAGKAAAVIYLPAALALAELVFTLIVWGAG